MEKKILDQEMFWKLVWGPYTDCSSCEHSHNCQVYEYVKDCPILASLPACKCDQLSKIAAAYNHYVNGTEQDFLAATTMIIKIGEVLGKPWEETDEKA